MTAPGQWDTRWAHLIAILDCEVNLAILELQAKGGPSEGNRERARAAAEELATYGDVLLYGGGKPGQRAHLIAELAHGLAVLAFCPGGVKAFGERHWVATVLGPAPAESEDAP